MQDNNSTSDPSMATSQAQPAAPATFQLPPIHLAGISSLTNLLAKLPLPSALPDGGNGATLLTNPQIQLMARQLLASTDEQLAGELAACLGRADTSTIALKEPYNRAADTLDPAHTPPLLAAILAINPRVLDAPAPSSVSPNAPPSRSASNGVPTSDGGRVNVAPPQVDSVHSMTPSTSADCPPSATTPTSTPGADFSLRRQIVSVGKQPKAQSRRKKDLVSELFDSLTPAAEYFQEGSRRRRAEPRLYNDDDYETLVDAQLGEPGAMTHMQPADVENRMPLGAGHDEHSYRALTADDIERVCPRTPVIQMPRVSLSELSSETKQSFYEDQLARLSGGLRRRGKRPRDGSSSPVDAYDRPLTPENEIRQREQFSYEDAVRRRDKYSKRLNLDSEELVQTESFASVCNIIDQIFDNVEEFDIAGADEEDEIPQEMLIGKSVLAELQREMAKLKQMRVTSQLPVDRLVKLLTILEKNVRDTTQADHLLPLLNETDDESDETARELISDRMLRSADAALAALLVMTSPRMPKQVYIEDTIERCVQLTKLQLVHVIVPALDVTYRAPKQAAKDGAVKAETPSKRTKKGALPRGGMASTVCKRAMAVIDCLAELVVMQPLTDATVLQLSTVAVQPFFLENVGATALSSLSSLQLSSMRLATAIFARYEKYRILILNEILSSLHHLPTGKNRCTYRLTPDESIQMVTALVMQLVQATVRVPSSRREGTRFDAGDVVFEEPEQRAPPPATDDADVAVHGSYVEAKRCASYFLSNFLNKCTAKSEEDYRRIFDGFINDLLAALHRAEWPSAELMLSTLGRLLVDHFHDKSKDMSLRVASLDYLGTVTARLRRDSVGSSVDEQTMDRIVLDLSRDGDDDDDDDARLSSSSTLQDLSEDKMQILRRALIDFLNDMKQNDPAVEFARLFYIAQWYEDTTSELERKTKGGRKSRDSDMAARLAMAQEQCNLATQQSVATKQFLLTLVDCDGDRQRFSRSRSCDDLLSSEQSTAVVKYFASKRVLSQSFDWYLKQILFGVRGDTAAVNIRTKAMRCLALVIEADPEALARAEVQAAVQFRLHDPSASVRDATVELIGKYVLARPHLTDSYYRMFIERIRDTGLNVRKRVIRILKEICSVRPDYERLAEICCEIIRRVADEESVKKLVVECFQSLWFAPVRAHDKATLLKKVMVVMEVVEYCWRHDCATHIETLFCEALKGAEKSTSVAAARQIVDCLVETLLSVDAKLAEGGGSGQARLMSCLTALYLCAEARSSLLVKHTETLLPYLRMSCTGAAEQEVLVQVIKILERVVPLMEHPADDFLRMLEESLISLVQKSAQMVVITHCITCLSAVLHRLGRSLEAVFEVFRRFYGVLIRLKQDGDTIFASQKPSLLRSLFAIGLLARYFDIDMIRPPPDSSSPPTLWSAVVYKAILFHANSVDPSIRMKAFAAIGNFCARYTEFLRDDDLTKRYRMLLQIDDRRCVSLKVQVLKNLQWFLNAEESKMIQSNAEWKEAKDAEDLKEMGDQSSGQGAEIIQLYWPNILVCFFNADADVRRSSAEVVALSLQQGLLVPDERTLETLMAMSTDPESSVALVAEKQLKDFDQKFHGLVQGKAMRGVRAAFRLQAAIAHATKSAALTRGYKTAGEGADSAVGGTQALLAAVYRLMRSEKKVRRNFVGARNGMLRLFEESAFAATANNQALSLAELLFIADNLAAFPYQTLDEPHYVIHQTDAVISMTAPSILQAFKEQLGPRGVLPPDGSIAPVDDEDDETPQHIFMRLPVNTTALENCIDAGQGCFLLLQLKEYLKRLYGISESKLQEYPPAEGNKSFDKALSRRSAVKAFNPRDITAELNPAGDANRHPQETKYRLCEKFVKFRQLWNAIDAAEPVEMADAVAPAAAAAAAEAPA